MNKHNNEAGRTVRRYPQLGVGVAPWTPVFMGQAPIHIPLYPLTTLLRLLLQPLGWVFKNTFIYLLPVCIHCMLCVWKSEGNL